MGEAKRKRTSNVVVAPRIEVMLVTDDKTGPERYEALLVAHVPDGKPPHVVKLAGGPYDRNQSLLLIESIYTEIGKKFGTEESKRGMQGVIAN
jgi:hypothetical protein